MASGGKEKFNKYFSGKTEVEVIAKGSGGKAVSVFEAVDGLKKVDSIKDGTPITVIPGKTYQPRYFVKYKGGMGYLGDAAVGKPSKSKATVNSELGRITASDFIKGGKSVKFMFIDQEIDCKEFTSPRQLMDSIIDGMDRVRGVSEPVKATFTKLFKNSNLGDFEWDADVEQEEVKKFGVYFGELLIGLYALAGKTASHINPVPWQGIPKRFLLPTDAAFSGVDSFLEMADGEIVPISSKFGTGAAASFFSNLLIKGILYADKIPNSVFKDIIEAAKAIHITADMLDKKKGAKDILYEFGIRNILGLDKRQIPDTYKVFTAIKTESASDEKNLVVSKIANIRGLDKKIEDSLEESTTAFFCRSIADMLMADKVSMETMKEILSGKNYWQANLNLLQWDKGVIKFSLVNSGHASLKIIGNKSAINDADAKQGLINYILKVQ